MKAMSNMGLCFFFFNRAFSVFIACPTIQLDWGNLRSANSVPLSIIKISIIPWRAIIDFNWLIMV